MIDEKWLNEYVPDLKNYNDSWTFSIGVTCVELKELIRLARLGLWSYKYGGTIKYSLERMSRDAVYVDQHWKEAASEALAKLPVDKPGVVALCNILSTSLP